MSRKSWLKRWKVWKDNPESMDPPKIHCLRMVHGTRTYTHTENNHDNHDSTTVLSTVQRRPSQRSKTTSHGLHPLLQVHFVGCFTWNLGHLDTDGGWLVRTCMRTMQGHLYICIYIICMLLYVSAYLNLCRHLSVCLSICIFVYLSFYRST